MIIYKAFVTSHQHCGDVFTIKPTTKHATRKLSLFNTCLSLLELLKSIIKRKTTSKIRVEKNPLNLGIGYRKLFLFYKIFNERKPV